MGTSVSCRVMACWLLGVFSYLWLPFFFLSAQTQMRRKSVSYLSAEPFFFPPSPPVLLSILHQGFGFFFVPRDFQCILCSWTVTMGKNRDHSKT